MAQFKTASWSKDKIAECRKELDTIFFEATGKGNGSRMNPRAVDIINKDRVDIAETIVNLIQQEVDSVNPLPLLVQTVTGDIRNQYVWQELDSSLRVVSRSYGSKPLSQRLTFREFSMQTSMKEIAVEIALEEVFAGRLTPSLAASEMAYAITRYRISTVLDALDAAIPSVGDRTGISGYNLRYTCSGSVTQAAMDQALDGLADESESPTIFGRHVALFPAMRTFGVAASVSQYSLQNNDELFRRGVVGEYHGAKIVELRDQFARKSADHLIRKDKIWVAGGNAAGGTLGQPGAAIFMDKPVEFLNWAMTDARTATFGTGIRLEDGLMVRDPYQYRIITIT